jgi:hypothetical protein
MLHEPSPKESKSLLDGCLILFFTSRRSGEIYFFARGGVEYQSFLIPTAPPSPSQRGSDRILAASFGKEV